jgi:N-methylhydantoinase A
VVDALLESDIDPSSVAVLLHGTTVTTNALLTRNGAQTALIATQGFRDALEIRDGSRGEYYDINWNPPPPLVDRPNRLTVPERINHAGQVVAELDESAVRDVAARLRKRGVEAVAVCLLHSYSNPAHEHRVVELLQEELPDVYVCASADILAEPPEFPRTSTTVANAYVGPILQGYLAQIQDVVREQGCNAEILIMHSGGGTMTPANAVRIPVRTAISGPAAGVMASAAIARASNIERLVSLDMGGTSADISTVVDGKVRITNEQIVEWGLPVGFPSVDLITIGAGGGSIAWIDDAGAPHVGPQSAGAAPGPACYGMGGEDPTTCDANVIAGRLRPRALLDGAMTLDVERARQVVAAQFSGQLDLDVEDAAEGILRITNENMANGIRGMTVKRGLDPREFSLVAFGGAGPLHAAEIAELLEIPEVVVPYFPGATSALGLLTVDAQHDLTQSHIVATDKLDIAATEDLFQELEVRADALLEAEGFDPEDRVIQREIDLRYIGQVRALTLPVGGTFDEAALASVSLAFHSAYEAEFKYAVPELPIETRSVRVSAVGLSRKPDLGFSKDLLEEGDPVVATEPVRWRGTFVDTPFYQRNKLPLGFHAEGPAVIEQYDSTTAIPPGMSFRIDEIGNIRIQINP